MIIRNALHEDLSQILSLVKQKVRFDPNIPAFSDILKLYEYRFRPILFNNIPCSYILVPDISGRLAGFAVYKFDHSSFMDKPTIWLDELYIDEEMRSQGIGSELMRHLAKIGKDYGCGHVTWYADERNTRCLNFYERLGARITDQKDHRCFVVWTL